MTTNEKLGWKKAARSLQVSESLYENCLGWTRDVYSFYILLHVYVTYAGCSEQLLLLLLLLLLGALQQLLRLCSWTVGNPDRHLELPSESGRSLKEAARTPAVMECVPAAGQPDRIHSSGRAFMDVWMFSVFVQLFTRDPIALWPSLGSTAWTANAWPLTLCAC